jgi:hypothetical protein
MQALKKTKCSSEQIPRPTHYGFRRTLVADWSELLPNDIVVLEQTGSTTKPISAKYTSGTVDLVSEDGAFLWLMQEDGAGRRLFFQSDGYITLVNPRMPPNA